VRAGFRVVVLPAAGLPCGARGEVGPSNSLRAPWALRSNNSGQSDDEARCACPPHHCAPRHHPGARRHSACALFRLAGGVRWFCSCVRLRGVRRWLTAAGGGRLLRGGWRVAGRAPSYLGGARSFFGGAWRCEGGGPSVLLGERSFRGVTPSVLLGASGSELGECTSLGRERVLELGVCL